jgi:hypothetical protein
MYALFKTHTAQYYPGVQTFSSSQRETNCPPCTLKQIQQNKKRGEHKEHCRAVASGLTPPRTVLPETSPPLPLDDADFLTKDWRKEFHVNPGEHPTARNLCRMGWSCKGRLFPTNQHYDYLMAIFLTGVTSHMKKYNVDIMWLTDAYFVAPTPRNSYQTPEFTCFRQPSQLLIPTTRAMRE